MTSTADLSDLLGRVEKAAGATKELDRLIARWQGWHRVEPRFSRSKYGAWIKPEDFMGVEGDGRPRLDSLHGTDMWPDVPNYTASLDAALGLCERVLPTFTVDLTVYRTNDGGFAPHALARLFCPYGEITEYRGDAKTPALALLAALLRALIASNVDTLGGGNRAAGAGSGSALRGAPSGAEPSGEGRAL